MDQIINYLQIYAIIALGFLLFTALINGFVERETTLKDVWGSVCWPITWMEFTGLLAKLSYNKITGK